MYSATHGEKKTTSEKAAAINGMAAASAWLAKIGGSNIMARGMAVFMPGVVAARIIKRGSGGGMKNDINKWRKRRQCIISWRAASANIKRRKISMKKLVASVIVISSRNQR